MTERAHTEIEAKYDASPGVTVPSLADGVCAHVDTVGDPVDSELVATYHDTADLRLARAGVTLRRRTGGDDEGWHLKLPEALHKRIELRRPLGRSQRVPRPFVRLLTATVRRERLDAVATVRTHRSVRRLVTAAGDVLAEVADDRVEGELPGSLPQTWREIEVELVQGEAELLDQIGAALVAAGATPADAPSKLSRLLGNRITQAAVPIAAADTPPCGTAGELVLSYVRQQRDELVALDPLVRGDAPQSVHKMRVATRRLRSALATHRRLFDRAISDPLRDELKWLAGEIGAVRDSDVIGARIEALLNEQPRTTVVGPVRRRLRATLGTERRAAYARLLDELRGDRYLALLDRLDELATGRALAGTRVTKPANKATRKELRREHERWRRRVDRALALDAAGVAAEQVDRALHEVRKASKRMRYAAESAQPISKEAAELASDMEDLQELLGGHQDTVVTRAVLRRLATAAHAAGEDTFTWGRLHAIEEQRAERAAQRFGEQLEGGWPLPGWLD